MSQGHCLTVKVYRDATSNNRNPGRWTWDNAGINNRLPSISIQINNNCKTFGAYNKIWEQLYEPHIPQQFQCITRSNIKWSLLCIHNCMSHFSLTLLDPRYLTHRPQMPYIYTYIYIYIYISVNQVSIGSDNGFSAPCHYLNRCWVIVNWALTNQIQWRLYQNKHIFIHENAYWNIVCEIATVLSRGRWSKVVR